jgi:opacity protein-like surface antigen
MTGVRAIVIGCMGAFAFVASAHAASPRSWRRPAPEPEYERPDPRYRELMSGWYLRCDIGYRWYGGGPSAAPITDEKFSGAVAGTLGFGLKYHWFRADLTYDRGTATNASATTSVAATQPQYTAKISSQSVLTNAYIDFGTWAGFTPYVGAGVGMSWLKSVNYLDTMVAPPPNGAIEAGKSRNFSWAAMAGVAYKVAPTCCWTEPSAPLTRPLPSLSA